MFSGLGSLIIGFTVGERVNSFLPVLGALGVGFVAYGLSIFFYVYAQRFVGAARTSAYYAVAPFIGVLLSIAIFQKLPVYSFWIALVLMAIGAWLCSDDKPIFKRKEK